MRSLQVSFGWLLLPFVILVAVVGASGSAYFLFVLEQLPQELEFKLGLLERQEDWIDLGREIDAASFEAAAGELTPASRISLEEAVRALQRDHKGLNAEGLLAASAALDEAMRSAIAAGERLLEGTGPVASWEDGSAAEVLAMGVAVSAAELPHFYDRQVEALRSRGLWLFVLFLVGVVGAVALSFAITVRLSARVMRPIETFIETIEDVAKGDLSKKPVQVGREYWRLADAFDRMLDTLRQDRLQLNHDLLHTRKRMESLIEHLPSPVYFFNAELRLDLFNAAGRALFEELPELSAVPSSLQSILLKVRDSGQSHIPNALSETVVWRLDGVDHAYLPRVFRLNPDSGDDGIALLLIDVTKLRLTVELQEDLLRVVRHELKTPLTSARLALHMLHDDSFGSLSETQRELVETARVEVERQLRMLDNLLELGGVDPEELELAWEDVRSGDILSRVEKEYAEEAEAMGVFLKLPADEGVPWTVVADRVRLQRALGLFLGFLLKSATRGSPLFLEVTTDRGELCFSSKIAVADLNEEVNPKGVFQMIETARSTAGRQGNPEFALAWKVAEAHRGTIHSEISPDGKLVLSILIPLQPSKEEPGDGDGY